MKHCVECNQELKNEAKFCHKCGASQKVLDTTQTVQPEEVSVVENPATLEEIVPTKFEKEVAKVAQNIKNISKNDMKLQAANYHKYFKEILKSPGKKIGNVSLYYGAINILVYAISFMIFMWGIMSNIGQLMNIIGGYGYNSYDLFGTLNPFAGDFALIVGTGVSVVLFAMGLTLYVTQRYVLHRPVSYLYVLERFTSQLPLASILMLVAGLFAKLGFSVILISLFTVAALSLSGFVVGVAPIITIVTEQRRGGREIPPLYAILIHHVLFAVLMVVVNKLLG